jgi:hypothetical protein
MQTVTAGRTYSVVPIEMGAIAVRTLQSIYNEKAEALGLGPFIYRPQSTPSWLAAYFQI